MKVTELFEASGTTYYSPTYDEKKGWLRGSVDAWMKEMGISKDDVAKAIVKVKKSPIITTDFPAAGLEYVELPTSEKNGTLTFQVNREWDTGYSYKGRYKVYANGQIRSAVGRTFGEGDTTSPLKSPKPRFKKGDPVGSVEMLMTAALKEVLAKWKKSKSNKKK